MDRAHGPLWGLMTGETWDGWDRMWPLDSDATWHSVLMLLTRRVREAGAR